MTEPVDKPQFMSPAHVALMNHILASAADVRAAAASLDRDYLIAYRLTDGPGGDTVHWQMTFYRDAGVAFALDAPTRTPDLTLVCGWREMIAGTRAAKAGEPEDIPLQTEGDPAVMEVIGPVFAAAQAVATVDTTFPPLD